MMSSTFDRLRPIGFTPAFAAAFEAAVPAGAWPARVIEIRRETVLLDDGDACLMARLHPHLAMRSGVDRQDCRGPEKPQVAAGRPIATGSFL